jgi:hypothetical protein
MLLFSFNEWNAETSTIVVDDKLPSSCQYGWNAEKNMTTTTSDDNVLVVSPRDSLGLLTRRVPLHI